MSNARPRGRPKAFHDKTASATIRSLDRAMDILKTVAGGAGMTLSEVAAQGNQSPATVYRVLTTLHKHHMCDFDETSQRWHIGAEAFRIGSRFLGRTQIVEQSRSAMERLMAQTGETANLAIIDRGEVIFISQVETHEPIRAFFRPGTRGAVHCSGIGKAILAHSEAGVVERIVEQQGLERFTPNTISDAKALEAELARTRQRGWAIDDEERTAGMRCIAAPIFDHVGNAVAGISVSGPTVRMPAGGDDVLGRLVREAADTITTGLGGVAQ